jgi:histidinol-phosphate aminotransferase
MALSRRAFVRTLGVGGAGAISGALVAFRGREALAGTLADPFKAAWLPVDPNEIRLDSNENPYGPGPVALDAIRAAFGESSRYPDVPALDLTTAIARFHGVTDEHVLLGSGSGEVLRMAVFAFTSATRPLVAGLPTFEDPGRHAEVAGAPVRAVPVDVELKLDLAGMASQADGAGLVFLCNPNNPTATVHPAQAVADFVKTVNKTSPDTIVLVDEAYHHYVEDPSYATALPLALDNPRVVICRTFSKVYGMAGLRIGYAVGRPETLKAMRRHKLPNSINVLGAAAAVAALDQKEHVEQQRKLNHDVREMTRRAFESLGFKVGASETNFIMADIRRDSKEFQNSCRKLGILVGRPFPPLLTRARISIGTEDEMRRAIDVFRKVLET